MRLEATNKNMYDIKLLRKYTVSIAGEFVTELSKLKKKDIYKEILGLTPYLLNCVEAVREYCMKRNYISGI